MANGLEANVISAPCDGLDEVLLAQDSAVPGESNGRVVRRGRESRDTQLISNAIKENKAAVRNFVTAAARVLRDGSIGTDCHSPLHGVPPKVWKVCVHQAVHNPHRSTC